MTKTFEEWAGMKMPPAESTRQHTYKAWNIASLYSCHLASETRDLAAHIDIALREAFTAGRAAGINQAASHIEGQLKMARDFDPTVAMILGAIVREIRALNKEGE